MRCTCASSTAGSFSLAGGRQVDQRLVRAFAPHQERQPRGERGPIDGDDGAGCGLRRNAGSARNRNLVLERIAVSPLSMPASKSPPIAARAVERHRRLAGPPRSPDAGRPARRGAPGCAARTASLRPRFAGWQMKMRLRLSVSLNAGHVERSGDVDARECSAPAPSPGARRSAAAANPTRRRSVR